MMNRRSQLAVLLGIAFFVLPAGRAPASALFPDEMIKLPTGRMAKILSISKIEYSKGVMALLVRYQTTLTVDEPRALSQEVDEVWKIARKDVEALQLDDAIISSNETPKGIFITENHVLNFIYERGSDGKWTRLSRSDFMAEQ